MTENTTGVKWTSNMVKAHRKLKKTCTCSHLCLIVINVRPRILKIYQGKMDIKYGESTSKTKKYM